MIDKDLTPDEHGLVLAYREATKSDDRDTQVGIVLFASHYEDHPALRLAGYSVLGGCNRVARRYPGGQWWERPQKYDWIMHAERNVVALAARLGVPLLNSIAYVWASRPLFCCAACANDLVAAGVREIVFNHRVDFDGEDAERYGFGAAREIFDLNGVAYRFLDADDQTPRVDP